MHKRIGITILFTLALTIPNFISIQNLERITKLVKGRYSDRQSSITLTSNRDIISQTKQSNIKLLQVIKGHQSKINKVVFSVNDRTISSVSSDGIIKLWNLTGRIADIRAK